MGVPLTHPFLGRIFHEINHPAFGVPPFHYISLTLFHTIIYPTINHHFHLVPPSSTIISQISNPQSPRSPEPRCFTPVGRPLQRSLDLHRGQLGGKPTEKRKNQWENPSIMGKSMGK